MSRLKAFFAKRSERAYILTFIGYDYMCKDFVCYSSYFCKNKDDAKSFGEIVCKNIMGERFCDCFYIVHRIRIKKYMRRYYEQINKKRCT